MAKRLEEYVKYKKTELDLYVSTPGSCVHKINTNRHYTLDPYVLSDLKTALPAYILKHEISYYEPKLQGLLLAVKNIKVLNGVAALRADDAHLHIDINADCYVFRPEEGAELTGIVKHIGKYQVSLVLYRVFNAKIKFKEGIDKEQLKLGQELKFRVRSFGMNGIFVNIDGEILSTPRQDDTQISTTKKGKKIIFKDENDEEDEEEKEEQGKSDSGIEEEHKLIELDDLLNSIKNEPLSEEEFANIALQSKQKPAKRKHKNSEVSVDAEHSIDIVNIVKNEVEPSGSGKKRQRKSSLDSVASSAIKNEFGKKIKIKKELLE